MVTNLTAIAAVLKKDILPAVVDAVKQKTALYQIAKGDFKPQKFANNRFFAGVQLAQSSGFTSYGPTASPNVNRGRISPVEGSWELVQMTQSFVIDKITLDSGKGAVVDTLELQSRGARDTIIRQLNFGLWRAGGTAPVFFANGAGTSSTTLVIDENRLVANGDIDYAAYIPPGTRIRIAGGAAVEVTAHPARNTLTLAAAQTWADNAEVRVVDGDGGNLTYLTGLMAAVGTGVYAGINPAAHAMWRSFVSSPAAATALTATDVDLAFVEAKQHGEVKHTFMNKTLFRRYAGILRANPQIQVTTDNPMLNGGWSGIKYMGNEIVLDYDIPDDVVMHISPEDLALGTLAPLDFIPGNDGTLFKAYGKTEWEATLYTSMQLVCLKRNAHALLERRTA
jgi:hypothetical protein